MAIEKGYLNILGILVITLVTMTMVRYLVLS